MSIGRASFNFSIQERMGGEEGVDGSASKEREGVDASSPEDGEGVDASISKDEEGVDASIPEDGEEEVVASVGGDDTGMGGTKALI